MNAIDLSFTTDLGCQKCMIRGGMMMGPSPLMQLFNRIFCNWSLDCPLFSEYSKRKPCVSALSGHQCRPYTHKFLALGFVTLPLSSFVSGDSTLGQEKSEPLIWQLHPRSNCERYHLTRHCALVGATCFATRRSYLAYCESCYPQKERSRVYNG
jgi:hypothetical protein